VLDDGIFFEIHAIFAPNILCGFGRVNGRSVGIVANQPSVLAGVLDIKSSTKAARFVRFCDAFNIPLLTFVDVPGFLPGIDQEYGGIIVHGAKLLYAFAEATVPKITIITRKAYGGAYERHGLKTHPRGRQLGLADGRDRGDGRRGRRQSCQPARAGGREGQGCESRRAHRRVYERFANPYIAASRGYVDDVIEARRTRGAIATALAMLENKRVDRPKRKHGNIPL